MIRVTRSCSGPRSRILRPPQPRAFYRRPPILPLLRMRQRAALVNRHRRAAQTDTLLPAAPILSPAAQRRCQPNQLVALGQCGRRRIDNHGRSVVNISSFANGASGEHRRHDTDGMRLRSRRQGAIERAQVDGAKLPAGWAGERQPGEARLSAV